MSVGLFNFRALGKYWELIPITAIMSVAITGATAFMGYALYEKPDVWVMGKTQGLPPWEKKKMQRPCNMKEFLIGRHHVTMPEIEALRREIGSYKAR